MNTKSSFNTPFFSATGLYGNDGLLPARWMLRYTGKGFWEQLRDSPTLLWLGPKLGLDTQQGMELIALIGTVLSLLSTLTHRLRDCRLYLCLWILYLSLYQVMWPLLCSLHTCMPLIFAQSNLTWCRPVTNHLNNLTWNLRSASYLVAFRENMPLGLTTVPLHTSYKDSSAIGIFVSTLSIAPGTIIVA